MFNLSFKEFNARYYRDKIISRKCNKFYSLDCRSGEGLPNLLFKELKENFTKENTIEFEFYLEMILKKCININRSFSDAIEFLSLWLKLSPYMLLHALKNRDLITFFNRTVYHLDGNSWCFPKLLQSFLILIKEEKIIAIDLLDYLFETFDFFSMPEIFIGKVIGYDRLKQCIEDSPKIFKEALLFKINEFVIKHKEINIGANSIHYLNEELSSINSRVIKPKIDKNIYPKKLVSQLKNQLFVFPNTSCFNPSELSYSALQSMSNRGS